MADKKAILVIGAGSSTRGTIAKCFAKEGCIACVTRRTVAWTHEMELRSWMETF